LQFRRPLRRSGRRFPALVPPALDWTLRAVAGQGKKNSRPQGRKPRVRQIQTTNKTKSCVPFFRTKTKIHLSDARQAAESFCRLIEPVCERIEIAGSIRRQAALVGDLEIVCIPRLIPDPRTLLGGELVSALDRHVDRLVRNEHGNGPRAVAFNTIKPANGSKYKRLIRRGATGPIEKMKLDLFAVLPPGSWGSLFAIRTGPWDFSRMLVTKRSQGGALPDNLQQRTGALWGPSGKIDTPEETDFFAALGVPYWPPEDRTADRLREFLIYES
jgi:DNA polymerase/3'-5' exonuclease PolX